MSGHPTGPVCRHVGNPDTCSDCEAQKYDHERSVDPDGKPLHYCSVCFHNWPCPTFVKVNS